jgi:hypothetical protein
VPVVVRPQQQRVVLELIPDQERLRHHVEVPVQVLHALRNDRLALAVLVDLLLAVHEPVVSVIVHGDDIAGREPALVVHAAVAVVRLEVPGHHVGAADEKLPVVGDAQLDARQGATDGAVAVSARGGHGDAAGRLGHAVPAAQGDARPVHRAKHDGVEVSRGG